MHVVHLGRLKLSRKAAGQMDLLTVPSLDDADMRFRQDMYGFPTGLYHPLQSRSWYDHFVALNIRGPSTFGAD